jgi:putative transposase
LGIGARAKAEIVPTELRPGILAAVEEAVAQGLTREKACETLDISVRAVERWMKPAEKKPCEPRKPPINALPPAVVKMVMNMIKGAAHADYSARELSLTLLEKKGIYVSHVAFWQAQVRAHCNGPRRGSRLPKGRGNRPETSWVTGPNQLYSWDITHLPTGRPFEFWYLYALQDWFSRKVVSWLITDNLASDTVQDLWDQALINEGLLVKPQAEWPKSLSDRGTQMRAASTRRFFKRLGVDQLFARPRTPNDNPKIEALFSVFKSEPEYPGQFPRIEDARAFADQLFSWLNDGHPHTALGMLTPSQVHRGDGAAILAARRSLRDESLALRREFHETGIERLLAEPASLPGLRALPMRFQYPHSVGMFADKQPILSQDGAQYGRHLLLN